MSSRRNHILGHKTSLKKLRKTEIIPTIFPNHIEMVGNRNQKQKENWEIHKYVEIKQHTPKQSIGQRSN